MHGRDQENASFRRKNKVAFTYMHRRFDVCPQSSLVQWLEDLICLVATYYRWAISALFYGFLCSLFMPRRWETDWDSDGK